MKKYITFGNWNKSYLYIIVSVASMIVFSVIGGVDYYLYRIPSIGKTFGEHIYIHNIDYYLLLLICSSLFRIYEKKRDKKK